MGGRVTVLTILAMLAFAGNSLLCRMALGGGLIDAASFTAIRTGTGAAVLAMAIFPLIRSGTLPRPRPLMSLMLFVYMVCFSFAYISLEAGTGALLLFGAVQLTMLVAALVAGERLTPRAWLGFFAALIGLVYLVSPGLSAPDPAGATLMVLAGIGWGFYSLLGRNAGDPLPATAFNFLLCLPLVLLVWFLFREETHLTAAGVALATASGVVASALGYVIWYAALAHLQASRAATVQLSVPVIAAAGGVLLLSEPVTIRLVLASVITLGGIFLVLYGGAKEKEPIENE